MTVADGMYQSVYLPPPVTRVRKEVIKSFSHSKRVGGYLLGRTLGVGSFAKVKEGLHLTTGEKVAVKVIDKKRAKSDNYVRKNLRREGRLLQMVRHPNVVALFEVMETDNSYYLVTELCRGGDLMDYISSKKRLAEPEVIKFVRQIVSAVDYLHRLGIIHRDLKIENLLLDANKDIKLIDFGLSNSIKVTTSGEGGPRAQEFCVTQCGSPAYAAPELLNHEKYGLQVDLWSIGVNMYAMLTGSLPFTVEPFNIKALYAKMKDRQMNPVPDDLSKDCRDLLRKFLDPDPQRRVTICEALTHPWLARGNKPVPRSPCPNKLRTSDLEADILSHMAENLGFRMGEVIKFVTCNTPSPASATYHLFLARLARYNQEIKQNGNTPTASSSRLRDGKVTLHLQEVRRRSHHQAVSHHDSQPSTPTQRSRGQSARTDDDGSESPVRLVAVRKRDSDGATDEGSRSPSSDVAPNEQTSRPESKVGHATSALPFRSSPKRPAHESITKGNTSIGVHRGQESVDRLSLTQNKVSTPLPFKLTSNRERGKPEAATLQIAKDMPSEIRPSDRFSQDGTSKAAGRYVTHQNLKNKLYHRDINHNDSPATSRSPIPSTTDHVIPSQHSPNKLLVRRGLGQSLDTTNMLPTTGLKSVYRGKTSESVNAPTHSNKPSVKKIVPKQYVPFRSAQDRGSRWDSSVLSRITTGGAIDKSPAAEGMSLQGKTLMRPVLGKEDSGGGGVVNRPVVIKRKLIKRHRMGDITPPSSYVIQDVDQSVTTALISLDINDEKVSSPQPLPSISPSHTQNS